MFLRTEELFIIYCPLSLPQLLHLIALMSAIRQSPHSSIPSFPSPLPSVLTIHQSVSHSSPLANNCFTHCSVQRPAPFEAVFPAATFCFYDWRISRYSEVYLCSVFFCVSTCPSICMSAYLSPPAVIGPSSAVALPLSSAQVLQMQVMEKITIQVGNKDQVGPTIFNLFT